MLVNVATEAFGREDSSLTDRIGALAVVWKTLALARDSQLFGVEHFRQQFSFLASDSSMESVSRAQKKTPKKHSSALLVILEKALDSSVQVIEVFWDFFDNSLVESIVHAVLQLLFHIGSHSEKFRGSCCAVFSVLILRGTPFKNSFSSTIMRTLLRNVSSTTHSQKTKSVLVELFESCGEIPESGLEWWSVFLQHLSVDPPSRAEQRHVLQSSVMECILSVNIAERFVRFLFKLNNNAKTNCRLWAVEMLTLFFDNERIRENIQNFIPEYIDHIMDRCCDKSPHVRSKAIDVLENLVSNPSAGMKEKIPRSVMDKLGALFLKRTMDSKVAVRKSALKVISNLVMEGFLGEAYVNGLTSGFSDPSPLIRKLAISLFSELILTQGMEIAKKHWLMGVLKCVSDQEVSVQAAACDAVNQILFLPIVDPSVELTTHLQLLKDIEVSLEGQLQVCVEKLLQKKTFPIHVFSILPSKMSQANNLNFWRLFKMLSSFPERWGSPRFVQALITPSMLSHHNKTNFLNERLFSLGNFSEIIKSSKTRLELQEIILAAIAEGHTRQEFVKASIFAIQSLSLTDKSWVTSLLELIDSRASSITESSFEEISLFLELAGELSFQASVTLGDKVHLVVKDIALGANFIKEDRDKLRAQAFTCLGKFCFAGDRVARKYVKLLVDELISGDSLVIRYNILLIIYDLCKTFTSLIDPHIHSISALVSDPTPLIRKNALTILTQLLQEDYIKFRDNLLFRILSALVDQDASVRSQAHASLAFVSTRFQEILCQKFIEAVRFFNADKNVSASKISQFTSFDSRFQFPGSDEDSRKRRFDVYFSLINRMTLEQKHRCASSLCMEILVPFSDSQTSSTQDLELVHDALELLLSKELKKSVSRMEDDHVENENEEWILAAESKLINKVMKAHIVHNLLPILIATKRKLEAMKSALVKQVMLYLINFVSEHPKDWEEISGIDTKVANEIKFDIENFKKEQKHSVKQREHKRLSRGIAPGVMKQLTGNSDNPIETCDSPLQTPHIRKALSRIEAEEEDLDQAEQLQALRSSLEVQENQSSNQIHAESSKRVRVSPAITPVRLRKTRRKG